MTVSELSIFKQKLANYCNYRERSPKEVSQKLATLNLSQKQRDQIFIFLLEEGFVNEQRFADSYALGKFNLKKWGRIKIAHRLRGQGIGNNIVNQALKQINAVEYLSTMRALAQAKIAGLKDKRSIKNMGKLIKYLQQKGYENELIYPLVKDILSI